MTHASKSPNAELLVSLGFCQLSKLSYTPVSFLNKEGEPIHELSEKERLIANLARMALEAHVGNDSAQSLYVLVSSDEVMATGVYDKGSTWVKAEFEGMEEYGFRMVPSIGLVSKH